MLGHTHCRRQSTMRSHYPFVRLRPGMRSVMDRRVFMGTLVGLIAAPLATETQALQKIYKVGFVARPEAADGPPGRSFRDGLRGLGWVEGQTVTIDWRWTGNEPHQLDAVVTAFVRTGVDVIVT